MQPRHDVQVPAHTLITFSSDTNRYHQNKKLYDLTLKNKFLAMKNLIFILLFLSVYVPAHAYLIKWGSNITISKPVYEDLYIAGGQVTINAPIHGDLIVAGGTVTINDSVYNDLLLAGGTVMINGYVADDIRCAGGELRVAANVGNDVVITGGKVALIWTSKIGGGLMISGGDVTIDGKVQRSIKSASGKLIFNGATGGDFESRSQQLVFNGTVNGRSVLAARKMTMGNQASLRNDVRFWTRDGKLDLKGYQTGGTATYDPSLKIRSSNWYLLGQSTTFSFFWYLSTVFAFILVIELLFGKTFKKAGHTVGESVSKSIGLGLLFFLGIPIAAAILLLTIIGIPFALLLIASYVVVMILATVITSLVIANWYSDRFGYNWGFWRITGAAMILFILFKLVSFTPFLGWLIIILVACIAFGNIIRNIHWKKPQQLSMG